METTITKPVKEIPASDKRALEGMLGAPLKAEQEVFILAYTPGTVPSDEAKGSARRGIEQVLSTNQTFAKEQGITSAEANDAVAEAMRQTRRRA